VTLDLVETLSDLVAIPSVNPMGRPVSGPEFYEYRVTEYLEALFGRLGLRWQRQTVDHLRDNIFVRVDGDLPIDAPGGLILFEAHQDTVPVDGMTIEPWTPTIRDGRMYGRGSCDIKGGMAAMIAALARLAAERPAGRPTIVLACTVNEEHGFTGATALAQMWAPGVDTIIPRRPDAAVVAEPTSLNVVTAHKGTLRWRARTHGRACHSSQPHLGDNAVYKMARVLAALETYQRDVAPRITPHRLCGQATLSVGTITGGLSVNTVPDCCTIEIDRRLLPGEDEDAVWQGVIDHVARYPGVNFEVEHEAPFMRGATLSDGPNQLVADRLCATAQEVHGRCEQIGVPYGTDASKIALYGVPSIVFGPGSIDQAHTCDEWLPLDELQTASEVLYRFGQRGLCPA
jgi:acetylornithine deacetylase/succinyl-diaminopimelate desuccinylase-like protein